MLQNAATLNLNVILSESGYEATVEVVNETGHKLPSGYPEGRRMWINLQAYDAERNLIFESGAYDESTAILTTTDTKVYEAKLGMTQEMADAGNSNDNGNYSYTAGESFHFALNNTVIKDNRIPPRGFTNANFEAVQAAPIGYTYSDGAFSDQTIYDLPPETYEVEAKLYYQTVSKEYIEFLRDKNFTNNLGTDLYALWSVNGKSAPELMVEAEFYTDILSVKGIDAIKNLIKVYPNPVSSILNIKLGTVDQSLLKIEVIDIGGKLIETVYNEGIQDLNEIIKWDCSNIASGNYILKFYFANNNVSKKIIIKE